MPHALDRLRPAPLAPLALVLATLLLAACTRVPDGVRPVAGFDVQRYQGTWYSVRRFDHRFERGLTNVTARYALAPDGSVAVVNRGFDRAKCAWREIVGSARFTGAPDVASLAVTFFGPFSGGYHVFALDREGYRWAMVSGPTHGYLWILAREPQLAPAVEARLLDAARGAGFDVAALQAVDQSRPTCRDGSPAPPT